MSIWNLLDQSLTVQTESATKDSAGGQVKTWTATLSNIPCAVWPTSVAVRNEFSREDLVATHEIATDTDIAASDQTRLIVSGVTYLVLGYKPFVAPYFGPSIYVTVVSRRNQP